MRQGPLTELNPVAQSPRVFANPHDLCARWADCAQRCEIIEQLAKRGIDFQTVAVQACSRTPIPSTSFAAWPSSNMILFYAS